MTAAKFAVWLIEIRSSATFVIVSMGVSMKLCDILSFPGQALYVLTIVSFHSIDNSMKWFSSVGTPISLYGKPWETQGWQRLLDQEKVPYIMKGPKLGDFSEVNIVNGSVLPAFKGQSKGVFILEPELKFFKDSIFIKKVFDDENREFSVHTFGNPKLIAGKPFAGEYRLYEAYCDQVYPLVSQDKNLLTFSANISLLLMGFGFGFSQIERTRDESLLTLYIESTKIMRMMRKVLLEAFFMAGEPYVHFWYYPAGKPSVFLFRQDVDFVDQAGIKSLLEVTRKFGIRGTYFVNMSGEEEYEDEIGCKKLEKPVTPTRKKLLESVLEQGNELASHGYWHDVFLTEDENLKDLALCDKYFREIFGYMPVGYASPGGVWHAALARALDSRKFLYGCNGSLCHQGFPFYPIVDGNKTTTLEVPFDLISDAIFEGDCDDKKLKILLGYYLRTIDSQIERGEPVAIMGHPHCLRGKAASFYARIFQKVIDKGMLVMTVEEWARWWIERESITWEGGKSMEKKSGEVWVETVTKNGRSLVSKAKFDNGLT